MADNNLSYWGEIITFLTTITGFSIVSLRLKGRQDTRITASEKDVEELKGNRVHVNDFQNLERTMDREFGHVREALKRIEGKLP